MTYEIDPDVLRRVLMNDNASQSMTIVQQKAAIEQLLEEKDVTEVETDALVVERDALVVERDALVVKRDSLQARVDVFEAEYPTEIEPLGPAPSR